MAISLNTNALTTLENLKLALEIPSANTDFNDILTLYINSISEFLEKQTNNFFIEQTVSNEIYNGQGSYELILKKSLVKSVTSLEYRSWLGNSEIELI